MGLGIGLFIDRLTLNERLWGRLDWVKSINRTVAICALGYFVDIYDLVLFSIVRVSSLNDFGVFGDLNTAHGIELLNSQMAGLLLGGIIWGVVGDKYGRTKVMFGSILSYSLANIANAFIWDVKSYQILRFVAGIGLAGELGAAVTIVTESLSKENRGYATAIVTSLGILGALLASFFAKIFAWRIAFLIGGCLGLCLLMARVSLKDSEIFHRAKNRGVHLGRFISIFQDLGRLKRFLACFAIGLPCWFVLGLLLAFAPEVTRELGSLSIVSVGSAIVYQYSGAALGDLFSGFMSQRLKSRKISLLFFIGLTAIVISIFLTSRHKTAYYFYGLFFALGFSTGYWAVFVTVVAEQFGTNLRSSMTGIIPNFVRGAVIPMTLLMQELVLILSVFATLHLKESYGFELDYLES
ncbi:MAG: MFS transporter [Proteobacteria bacterium]|nr:MFS transporter [Pseudomonadota bacterium]